MAFYCPNFTSTFQSINMWSIDINDIGAQRTLTFEHTDYIDRGGENTSIWWSKQEQKKN